LTSKISEKVFNECEHALYKPLNYVIMFFHAVLLNRKKFGKIGFNIEYDFNESDFRISSKLLSLYLTKSLTNQESEMPWDSLKYLIGDAMYGGRVSDEFDERILKTYLDEYMGDFLFDKNNQFNFARTTSHSYSLPVFNSLDQLQTQNSNLPIFDEPTIFGLHGNAEITYFSNAAKEMWSNLIKMTNFNDGSGTLLTISERVADIAQEITDKLPLPFNIEELKSKMSKTPSSTYIVLLQEVERFNVLLNSMRSSLTNLNRALSGEIAMNSDIERFISDLNNGFLPLKWKKLCPQTNLSLASWMSHFRKRYNQYFNWCQKGDLSVIWLSGLHIPESYLTAVIQICCRKKKWALDKVKLRTRLTKYTDSKEVKKKLELGCYVEGLFMEGASWCEERQCITRQKPKELIKRLPLMEIVPVERRKLKGKNTIKIPVYVTQNRGNKMGEGLVFNADLTSYEHESHWILQGVAIVLNKD
jgi:dynein heavy chain